MSINLVTGFRNAAHITADDNGSLNAQIFGNGNFVFQNGKKLSAILVSNNLVRILDGNFMIQGRYARIVSGTFESMTIENGEQGKNRNDLIVLRYNRNAVSGLESVSCVVLKGNATSEDASDPAWNNNDIINENATTTDFPIYRVKLNGLNVVEVEAMFTVLPFVYNPNVTTGNIADGAVTPAKLDRAYLPVSGGTLTGKLILTANVHFGDELPEEATDGQIFFKKVKNEVIEDADSGEGDEDDVGEGEEGADVNDG